MSDFKDGIINSSVNPTKTFVTTRLVNVDASKEPITVELDAKVLVRYPITIVRDDNQMRTIELKGINGTTIVGPSSLPPGKYSYITLVIRSDNEMMVIGKG